MVTHKTCVAVEEASTLPKIKARYELWANPYHLLQAAKLTGNLTVGMVKYMNLPRQILLQCNERILLNIFGVHTVSGKVSSSDVQTHHKWANHWKRGGCVSVTALHWGPKYSLTILTPNCSMTPIQWFYIHPTALFPVVCAFVVGRTMFFQLVIVFIQKPDIDEIVNLLL